MLAFFPALLTNSLICVDQLTFLSNVIPRYFTLFVFFSKLPSSFIFNSLIFLPLKKSITIDFSVILFRFVPVFLLICFFYPILVRLAPDSLFKLRPTPELFFVVLRLLFIFTIPHCADVQGYIVVGFKAPSCL